MMRSKRNKLGIILVSIILLVLAMTVHVLYGFRLRTFQFSESRFIEHDKDGSKALTNGEYATAETHFNAALEEAEKNSPENEYMALALQGLVITYMRLDRYDDAESTCLKLIAVSEKVDGPESARAESARSMMEIIQRRERLKMRAGTDRR